MCIDSKLVVQGLMDGSGQVLGRTEQGDFPFTVKLAGFYSPATHTLTAQMVDGIVLIYGLLEVYFSGTFTGELTPFGDFDGVGQGSASETNVETITGLASGIGTWTADPVE